MFSLPKLLTLALIIVVVLLAFRLIGSVNRVRAENQRRTSAAEDSRRLENEDLEKCTVCGIFVQAGAGACDRSDCPKGRRR